MSKRVIARLVLLLVLLTLVMSSNIMLAQIPPEYQYRNNLLHVSDNGEIIAISGRIIEDNTSQTGRRLPD